jgi:putative flippase GtrA
MSDGRLPPALAALVSGVRFGKFVSVGAVGAAFDTAVLTGLRLGLGAPELVAKAAGIETAIVVMFLVNEHWTFSDEGERGQEAFVRRLLRSHLVRAGGSSVQFAIYTLLVVWVDLQVRLLDVDVWFLLASFLAIGLAMGVNYVFESLFTWRVHRE